MPDIDIGGIWEGDDFATELPWGRLFAWPDGPPIPSLARGAGPCRKFSQKESPMKATIWHNPNCSKSRETLALLQAAPGVEIDVVAYLKDPPSPEELTQLFKSAGIAAREGLRLRGTQAQELGLTKADDATVVAAMAADPKLIERPLVETEKGVRLCRPPEKVKEIL